jgi:cysteine desulfurase
MAGSGARFSVNGPGDESRRLPGNLSLSFPDIPREALFAAMADHGVAVSSGSACSSHDVAPSHVLTAMGIPGAVAQRTLRLGLGRGNTRADLDALVEAVRAAHRKAA